MPAPSEHLELVSHSQYLHVSPLLTKNAIRRPQGCRNVFKLGEDMIQNRQILSDFQKKVFPQSLGKSSKLGEDVSSRPPMFRHPCNPFSNF